MTEWAIREIASTITWIGFFAAVFFAYYYYLLFRSKERSLLIEKNIDLSEMYKKPEQPKQSEQHFPWYILGFSLLGIGLGMVISFFISYAIFIRARNIEEEIVLLIFISVTLSVGAMGMIIGHSIEQKKKALRG